MKGDQQKIDLTLKEIYNSMYKHFGPRGWWPGESVLEICIGAILTQSVSWKNVAKAIENIKDEGLMDLDALYNCDIEHLEKCIVPTIYFRMKAKKLKAFVSHLKDKYNGDFNKFFDKELFVLRGELLDLYGIGPETADSIILYAANKPIFVVDAYTKRIFSRLGLIRENILYDQMQNFFMSRLEPDVKLYNEYHALIVGVGNRYCSNKKTKCGECPVAHFCNSVGEN